MKNLNSDCLYTLYFIYDILIFYKFSYLLDNDILYSDIYDISDRIVK